MMNKKLTVAAAVAALSVIAACSPGPKSVPNLSSAVNPAPGETASASAVPTPVPSGATAIPSTPTAAPTFTPVPTPSPTVSPTPTAMPSYLPDTVWPVMDCLSNVKSTFYWEFGYISSLSGSKTLQPGSADNLIEINGVAASPQPQPSSFPSTGGTEAYRVFKVAVPGTGEQSITWTLDGNKIGPYGKEGIAACPE